MVQTAYAKRLHLTATMARASHSMQSDIASVPALVAVNAQSPPRSIPAMRHGPVESLRKQIVEPRNQ
jgi:hypothetical protein